MPPTPRPADGLPDDYYSLLGVDRMADPETLRKAYRTQAKHVHPDSYPFDSPERIAAEARFKALNTAYETLSDRASRAAYDAHLPPPPKHSAAKPATKEAPQAPPPKPKVHSWEVPADPVMRSGPTKPRPAKPPAFMDVLRDATRRRGHEWPEE